MLFLESSPKGVACIDDKEIECGHMFENKYSVKVDVTVDRYVRYVTVTIYKAVSGIWLITLKNMFLDKISGNKYSKTINFEGGSYRVLVRLDYSSRAEPVTLTVFYVKNPEGFNPMRYISVALISAGH